MSTSDATPSETTTQDTSVSEGDQQDPTSTNTSYPTTEGAGTASVSTSTETSADTSAESSVTPGVPPNSTPEQEAAQAASQSVQNDIQVVPEQRPQTFTQPDPSAQSAASLRAAANDPGPATQEDYDRANSDEAKAEADAQGRKPNLLVGQRVVLQDDHPEAGRMAHITAIEYVDGVNALLGTSSTPEARFAEVADYIVRTRDGRSDLLTATPDQVKPLEVIDGWGRGQI